MDLKKIIEDTADKSANKVIHKMKKQNMIYTKNGLYKNTEKLLRLFPHLEDDSEVKIKIKKALKVIKNDPYYEIITMLYFEQRTVEDTADILNTEINNVYKRRKGLVNKVKEILFAEEVGKQILNKDD